MSSTFRIKLVFLIFHETDKNRGGEKHEKALDKPLYTYKEKEVPFVAALMRVEIFQNINFLF